MPIYEYECLKCGRVHEKVQRFSDKPLSTCPDCGGEMKKIISNTSFILKGTGWYKTDYASSAKKDTSESDNKSDVKTGTKTAVKTESKAETSAKT